MSRRDEEVREAEGVKEYRGNLTHLLFFSPPCLLLPSWEVTSCFLTRKTSQVYSCRYPTLAVRPCFRNESSNTSLSLNCHTAPRKRCYVGVKKSFYRLRLSQMSCAPLLCSCRLSGLFLKTTFSLSISLLS